MTWQIWLAIASIIFIVFGLVKRLETRMLLIVAGFILCCASGAPMKAFGAFVKGMTNITLVPAICSAMGFAFAVQASKCDQHLVAAVAAPLKKLGGLLIQMMDETRPQAELILCFLFAEKIKESPFFTVYTFFP